MIHVLIHLVNEAVFLGCDSEKGLYILIDILLANTKYIIVQFVVLWAGQLVIGPGFYYNFTLVKQLRLLVVGSGTRH